MVLCAGAHATTHWSADFETPPYALGPINLQNGWSANSNNPTVIVDGTAPSGSQVLQMAGQAQNGNATASFASANVDLVKYTMNFDGPTYATSHAGTFIRSGSIYAVWAKFQESYGAGLGFYNIYGNTSQYAGAAGTRLVWNAGTWQKVEFWLDLANDQFAVEINDVLINEWYDNANNLIGTHTWTAFDNNIGYVNAIQFFVTIADNAGATPFKVDGLLVEKGMTIPEPGTVTVFGLGLSLLIARRRKG
jgi:PEP-CTERM motif